MRKYWNVEKNYIKLWYSPNALVWGASALPTDSPLLSPVVSTCIICNFERNKNSLNSTVSGSVRINCR